MNERQQKYYTEDEVVKLIKSLHRPQDNELFARDVLLQHPHLAEEYTRVCPRRCDLTTAAEKAAKDAYGYDVRLNGLRDDIELIVSNCIRFNGPESPYADIANSFGQFAREKIDEFVAKKTGGRRVSSLRVAALSEPTREKRQRDEKQKQEKKESRKRTQNENTDSNSNNNNSNNSKNNSNTNTTTANSSMNCSRSSSNLSGIATHELMNSYTSDVSTAELVKLAESLNRRADQNAFVVDVAEEYPDLRKAYEEVCPVKMNLAIVKERAASGYYLGQPSPLQSQQKRKRSTGSQISLFGSTLAESLVLLRNDVELIVNNCIRFNAGVNMWIQRAHSFQHFAHKKIDDFVLRHAPTLKGTRTGVEMYANTQQHQQQQHREEQEQQQQEEEQGKEKEKEKEGRREVEEDQKPKPEEKKQRQRQKQQKVIPNPSREESETITESPIPSPTPPSFSSKTNISAISMKKETISDISHSSPPPPPQAMIVNYVTPKIIPTALQPVFKIPDKLRSRVIEDHLGRKTLHVRLIHTPNDNNTTITGSSNSDNNNNINNNSSNENNCTENTFPPELSCRAVLDAFVISVRNYYRAQSERQDFVNPFEFLKEQEELYLKYVALVKECFERLFLHMLLYEREKADVLDWGSTKAAQQILLSSSCTLLSTQSENNANGVGSNDNTITTTNDNNNNNNNNNNCVNSTPSLTQPFCTSWLDEVHLCYLVRFIVHFPQLMALACAKKTTGVAKDGPTLQITKVEVNIIEKFAKITEELLAFIAKYEDKAVNMEESKEEPHEP